MRSGIYEGTVTHRRHAGEATGNIAHGFQHAVTLPYLFLDELDEVADLHPMWSARYPNAVWFRRADYLGDPAVPLDVAVRDAAHERLGRRPSGPIAMLGHLRTWGWLFNPITLYYCFDPKGTRVEVLVSEVTNTPWHERHVYALDGGERQHRIAKAMHVSPYLGMDHDYVMSWSMPGERLSVHLGNRRGADRLFDAALTLKRRELSRRELGRLVWRRPLQTYGVSAGIYRQAMALARKGAPFHPHPRPAAGSIRDVDCNAKSAAHG
jgi:DUF1365 family protein